MHACMQDGITPLMFAAKQGNLMTVEYLFANKQADADIEENVIVIYNSYNYNNICYLLLIGEPVDSSFLCCGGTSPGSVGVSVEVW